MTGPNNNGNGGALSAETSEPVTKNTYFSIHGVPYCHDCIKIGDRRSKAVENDVLPKGIVYCADCGKSMDFHLPGPMKTYTVLWTYVANYSDAPVVVNAKTPEQAIVKAFPLYAENDEVNFIVIEGMPVLETSRKHYVKDDSAPRGERKVQVKIDYERDAQVAADMPMKLLYSGRALVDSGDVDTIYKDHITKQAFDPENTEEEDDGGLRQWAIYEGKELYQYGYDSLEMAQKGAHVGEVKDPTYIEYSHKKFAYSAENKDLILIQVEEGEEGKAIAKVDESKPVVKLIDY